MAWSTRRLAGVAKGLTSAGRDRIDDLCRQILAVRAGGEDRFAGRSSLNNDGIPLQLCLSANANGRTLRLIGDPGADLSDTEARFRTAVEAVHRSLEESGSASLAPWVDRSIESLIPSGVEERSHYRDGFVWIAVSPEHAGVAVYIETEPLGGDGGWEAAERWLTEMLPNLDAAAPILQHLKTNCVVASLGLEGSEPASARAKVYFRFAVPGAVSMLGIDLLASQPILEFLQTAMGSHGVDRDGLILSAGFTLATGALADVKVDLCGHCLPYTDREWAALADRCADANGVMRVPVRDALATGDCEVALISLGVDVERSARINVYLKARTRADVPRRDELRAATRDGISALCALQEESGRVTDYELPVGRSDQWVTAYVGLALAQAGEALDDAAARSAAARAADWLTRDRPYAEGWGYNGRTGPDADSTAMSLALLRALGRPIAPADQNFMRARWRGEEGIATFSGPDAWGVAHWDVTPWGYLGLSDEEQALLRSGFLKALGRNRMPDGLWRAYWWRTPFYSTFVTLEVLNELGLREPDLSQTNPRPMEVDNAFDLSCFIGIEHFRGAARERIGGHLRALLEWQMQDGRWPGHANLRVTGQSCYEPWATPEGDYYKDEAGTITTATAVRVLAHRLRGEQKERLG